MPIEPQFRFKKFQREDYARAALHHGLILAHDTGLGKSIADLTWPLLQLGFAIAKRCIPLKPVLLVVPGTKEPVPFSSPWRTITLDRVDDLSADVQLAGKDGNFEISIPLAALGLKPAAGQRPKGDIGVLRGNGFQTLQRVYWANKASGITADVPSEAELTPRLWGRWEFK